MASMIIRCHQCGNAVAPDLAGLEELDALVLCWTCAGEDSLYAGVEGSGPGGSDSDSPPLVVNLDGELLLPAGVLAERGQRFREDLQHWRTHLLQELQQQLRLFRDAYFSMSREARSHFRQFVTTLGQLQDLEAEGTFGNPFCWFHVDFAYRLLEPGGEGSGYAGCYVGQEDRKVHLPKALAAALAAWETGQAFQIQTLADLEPFE